MSTWPGRALAVAAWVAVVAVGAVLAWVVISRAGAGLVAEAGPVTAPAADGTSTSPGAGGSTPTLQRATWQGDAGVVTATCQGDVIALVGAQPEDGVQVTVPDRGPTQLVVAFRGDEDGPVTVVARCQGGRPHFTVAHGSPTTSPEPSPPAPSSTGASSPAGDESEPGPDGDSDSHPGGD